MPGMAARVGDTTSHGGTILPPGAPTVLIGGMPAARLGDMQVCPLVNGTVPHASTPIITPGAPTVLIGGKPAATVGCMTAPPCAASIAMGCATVIIGTPAASVGLPIVMAIETESLNTSKSEEGGPYKEMKKPPGDGKDAHHIPAKDSYKHTGLDKNDGPAIKMDPKDHQKTASYGASDEAIAYRGEQKKLIDQGKFNEAMQKDIDDIKTKFPRKYDKALDGAVEYSKTIDSSKLLSR
jgi:uncharacterized Zn-binding protein involved in type VI secretion